jgi:hypothetical protein
VRLARCSTWAAVHDKTSKMVRDCKQMEIYGLLLEKYGKMVISWWENGNIMGCCDITLGSNSQDQCQGLDKPPSWRLES